MTGTCVLPSESGPSEDAGLRSGAQSSRTQTAATLDSSPEKPVQATRAVATPRVGLRPGQVLADKYRIVRVLGKGGMGFVLEAIHLVLEQRVAVKFMLAEQAESPETVERFLREARAAVRLQSEHIARVSDVGRTESEEPYIVMEYLEGQDLSQVLREQGSMPVQRAVDLVLQACEALAEAHCAGIIHRDIKPSNLFLTQRADGSPLLKVLDFGISKQVDSPNSLLETATQTALGSPLYMSPEQMRSAKHVDARTDLWALGLILQELLTGRPVFDADNLPALCAMIAGDPAPGVRQFRPEVPEPLEAAILRCLQKLPEDRYANVAEFAVALGPFASREGEVSLRQVIRLLRQAGLTSLTTTRPPSARTAGSGAQSSGVEAGTAAQQERTRGSGRRLSGWWIVASLVMIALGSLALRAFRPAPSTGAQQPSVPATERQAIYSSVSAVAESAAAATPSGTSPESSAEPLVTASARPKPPSLPKQPKIVPKGAQHDSLDLSERK